MSDTEDDLAEEASERFARLQSGRASAADRQAFAEWRAQSPAHEAAALEAEEIWHDLGETPTARAFQTKARLLQSRRWILGGGLAAGLAGAIVTTGVLGPAEGFAAEFRTRRGERRRVDLSGEGYIWLNTESAVTTSYNSNTRSVRLHAGEAVFHVEADMSSPLVIKADEVQVAMTEGECCVRRTGNCVEVSVSQGSADVIAAGARKQVRVDEQIRTVQGRFSGETRSVAASDLSAWTRGKLIFHDRPLSEVVQELRRYQFGVIHVSGSQLARTEVSGVFDLDSPEAALAMLPRILPVKVVQMPMLTVISAYP